LDPKGDTITLQNASRGVVIWLNDEKKEKVERITLKAEPIPVVKQSSCTKPKEAATPKK